MGHSIIKMFIAFFALFISGISGYSVVGNQLMGPTGGAIRLRGVDRPSFEWSATGQFTSLADYTLMRLWGFNIVRLSMNQDFWLSGASTYAPGYKASIAQQVAWIKSLGMGVILDLHWSDMGSFSNAGDQQLMADLNSITFWTQVATIYANDPWVMFELYNEPHDVSWSVWRNGGDSGSGWTVAGMQQLYNAVRATGANNVVIVNGLNWAFDLSGVMGGYAITGTNIAYGTHPYDYPGKQQSDWPAAFGNLAGSSPVVMTEFGQYCNGDNYVQTLLSYAEQNGIHWTAWAWWVGGCTFPSIIGDWSGTPFNVGSSIKSTILAAIGTSPSAPTTSPGTSNPTVPPPSVGATSAPISTAPNALSVFTSSLVNSWQSWSWGSVTVGSSSINLVLAAYGGIYLHTPHPFTIGSYASLQFAAVCSVSNPSVTVQMYDNSASPVLIGSAVALPVTLTANALTVQQIPISSFGLSSSQVVSGFAIVYTQGSITTNVLQVSSIAFLPASTSTTAPTQKPATAAPPTATPVPATAAPPTAKPATAAPPTAAPPTANPATAAPPTTPPTAATVQPIAATTPPSQGATDCTTSCSAACVSITQALVGGWQAGSQTVSQYTVSITNLCSQKTLTNLVVTGSNWNALSSWNAAITSSNVLTFPNLNQNKVAPGKSFTDFGYQSLAGQTNFVVSSATFA